jgi:HPr kinase/phosphorylase
MILRPQVAPDGRIHASAVAFGGDAGLAAAVIVGPSGSGKSALALALLALGARLVGDDHVLLHREDDGVIARPVPALRGVIEARGVGLLRASAVSAAPVAVVIDMAAHEPALLPPPRLPPQREAELIGIRLPCLQNVAMPHFPAAVRQYLFGGAITPENWP